MFVVIRAGFRQLMKVKPHRVPGWRIKTKLWNT